MSSVSRITYVFTKGRVSRMQMAHNVPTEFFYGLPQLRELGWDVVLLEDNDLGIAPPLPRVARLLNKTSRLFGGLPIGMVIPLLSAKYRELLCEPGIIIATTNGIGLALGILASVGFVKQRIVLLGMGLLSIDSGILKRKLYRIITRHLFLVSISRSEQSFLMRVLKQPVAYLPFGVDKIFWSPGQEASGDYVLSIGNDSNRDWDTLMNAWNTSLPPLKIVTKLPVPIAPPNVEVIKGDWRQHILSDEDVRNLLRGARFVVVPLKETIQPAGQSACLQAMACGKAVIMSEISGIWDRDLIIHGRTVVLTPPGDGSALAEHARRLADNPILTETIGAAGRKVIDDYLNADSMGKALEKLLLEKLSD